MWLAPHLLHHLPAASPDAGLVCQLFGCGSRRESSEPHTNWTHAISSTDALEHICQKWNPSSNNDVQLPDFGFSLIAAIIQPSVQSMDVLLPSGRIDPSLAISEIQPTAHNQMAEDR